MEISKEQILGVGMSDKVWEATIAHAQTCPVGEKLYLHQGSQCSLLLNPICQVVGIVYGDITLTLQQLSKTQRVITDDSSLELDSSEDH